MSTRLFGLCVLSVATGCLNLADVPLATARVDATVPCSNCRSPHGVLATIAGDDALPNATVIVYNLRIAHALGQRPTAMVRADAQGRWRVTLIPLRLAGIPELVTVPGDAIEVVQRDHTGDISPAYRLGIPFPEQTLVPPPFVGDPNPIAAEPLPLPTGS
jgi:hypothetical protein